jgi:hypothetical protein
MHSAKSLAIVVADRSAKPQQASALQLKTSASFDLTRESSGSFVASEWSEWSVPALSNLLDAALVTSNGSAKRILLFEAVNPVRSEFLSSILQTQARNRSECGCPAPFVGLNAYDDPALAILRAYLTPIRHVGGPAVRSQHLPMGQTLSAAQANTDPVDQDVPINADNDNGSTVTNTLPAVRDFDAGFTAAENDLVPLNAQWDYLNPRPPGTPYSPVISRRWNLGQAGGDVVRLKMWIDPQKSAPAPSSGTDAFPGVWLEGVEPSRDRSDVVSIDAFLWATHKDGYVSEFQMRTVRAVVTPVVDLANVTGQAPHVRGNPPTILNGFQADAYFRADLYVGANATGVGEPRYIQNLDEDTNDLRSPGVMPYALGFTDGTRVRISVRETQPGPNVSYPFLDKLVAPTPPGPYDDPYYDVPDYHANPNPQLSSIGPGILRLSAEDHPGVLAAPWTGSITEIGFTRRFRIHVVWAATSAAEPTTTFPLGYMDWYAVFRWEPNGTPTGNNSGSVLAAYDFVRSHDRPRELRPSTANDGTELALIG